MLLAFEVGWAAWHTLSNKSTKSPAAQPVSLFDPVRTKPLEISPGCQDLFKDISPANAALAVYPELARSIF